MAGSAALLLAANPNGGGVAPPAPLSGFITPSPIGTQTTNGSWTSPQIKMNASGGVAPYVYEWTATNGFSLSAPTSQKTATSTSGFDTIKDSLVTCKVTDDNLDTIEVTVDVAVVFGNQL